MAEVTCLRLNGQLILLRISLQISTLMGNVLLWARENLNGLAYLAVCYAYTENNSEILAYSPFPNGYKKEVLNFSIEKEGERK